MNLVEFSKKQLKVLSWWMPTSPVRDHEGIICDGSIRSGKTVSEGISFFVWAFANFEEQNFGLCGKTINSFRRNVWTWVKQILKLRGYQVSESRDENKITIIYKGKVNYFYVFGGRDERSQDLIQGITLAGVLFDEVALMPESFVNQATGRCSVTGSKYWFNCNPDNPSHWFKKNWIDKAKDKRLLYLHFTMDDNLSLSEDIKDRYKNLYVGVFFKRFILGLWVVAEGAIYDMFDENENTYTNLSRPIQKYPDPVVAIDYGTTNPLAALLCFDDESQFLIHDEYYFNSRAEGYQKTDEQYLDDIDKWLVKNLGTNPFPQLIIDPSAASFIVAARMRGYRVKEADNSVLDGIRQVATMFAKRMLKINKNCENLLREILGYVWDDNSNSDKEKPLKMNDHAVDAMRYWVKTKVNPRRLLG
jgi:PBSX family phage terminase large subunit